MVDVVDLDAARLMLRKEQFDPNTAEDDIHAVVEHLLKNLTDWRRENRNGAVIGFAGIAFFASIIREIAPNQNMAERLITEALNFELFVEDEEEDDS